MSKKSADLVRLQLKLGEENKMGRYRKRRRRGGGAKCQGVYFNFLGPHGFFLSWLSELWILADGSENVKYFAPVIPGVDLHNEKRKEKNEPGHSSVQQHAWPFTICISPYWYFSR